MFSWIYFVLRVWQHTCQPLKRLRMYSSGNWWLRLSSWEKTHQSSLELTCFLLLYLQGNLLSIHKVTWPRRLLNWGTGFHHRYLKWYHWYQWHDMLLFRMEFLLPVGDTILSAISYPKWGVGSEIVNLWRLYTIYQVQYMQTPHHLCTLWTHCPKFQHQRQSVVLWMCFISFQ